MRFLRLDFLAFGPFTDQSLELHEGQFGLHIVYGPNEAGKSSALRALRQLLYGIDSRSPDDFIHSYSSLRIGALLADADGKQLHMIRRKGNKNTLRGADDKQVIPSADLGRLLGGVDVSEFTQRFGIDHQELVTGGRDIVHGGGQLGGMLFAAGAGLADLNKVQSTLADEAEEFFKPRGSNPKINAALGKLKERRKALKEAQLRPAQWNKHSDALRAAETEKVDVDEQLATKQVEVRRMERLQQAIPLIAKRDHLVDSLSSLTDVPLLPDDFAERRYKTVVGLKTAEDAVQNGQKALEEIEAAIAELDVSDALLNQAQLISALQEEWGANRKGMADRPGLVAKRDTLNENAEETLRELGRNISLDNAEDLRLSGLERARIQELSSQWQALSVKLETANRQTATLNIKIDDAKRQLAEFQAVPDTAGLKEVVRRVRRAGDVAERLNEAKADVERLSRQADLDLRKLGLWSGSLEELEALPTPARETIERWETQLGDLDNAIKDLRRRQAEEQAEVTEVMAEIERHRLRQDTVTEDDLHKARRRRDDGWKLVQVRLHGESVDEAQQEAFVAEFEPATDLEQAYRISVEQADAIADRLRRESEQVAEKTRLVSEQRKRQQTLTQLTNELAEQERSRQQSQEQWSGLWAEISIQTLSPREMLGWLGRQSDLVRSAKELSERRVEVGRLEQRIKEFSDELVRELTDLGQCPEDRAEGVDLDDLLELSERVVERLDKQRREQGKSETKLQTLRQELPAIVQQAEEAEGALDAWREQWSRAMETLNLPPDATTEQADAVTAAIERLLKYLKETRELDQRIAGIDRDFELFRERVAGCTEELASDLADVSVEQAVSDLQGRLRTAQDARTRLEGLQQQRNQAELKLRKARDEVGRMAATLEVLCAEAGCDLPDQLPEIERQAAKRRECEARLEQVEDQLAPLAVGGTLRELLDEAAHVDADQLEPDIARLNEEITTLNTRRDELTQAIASEQIELRQMDGSGRAAEIDEEIQGLLAQVRNDAEQFVRLRLASVVLKHAIERYREKNQGPVLQRASQLFAELTLGSFAGLRDDYDDKGEPVLVGLRGDRRSIVGVQGMSDGSRDQLYLALRLASLEHYLEQNSPIPFIVDDILVQFDDARAAAALRVLADLSDRTQVIFFTHHEHLTSVAREQVSDRRLFVHRLGETGGE